MPAHPYVTADMQDAFRDDGVVLLPQVLGADWMDLVELGIRRNLRTPGPYFQHHYDGTPRAFIDDFCNYWSIPEYRMLVEHSPIAEIVASVLGSENLWLFYEQIFVKDAPAGEARRTPWHQDITYWITGGTQLAGFWITLDDTPAEDSLEFVRGIAPRAGLRGHGVRLRRRDDAVRTGVGGLRPHPGHRGRSRRLRHRVVPDPARRRRAVPPRPAARRWRIGREQAPAHAVHPLLRRRRHLRAEAAVRARLPGHRVGVHAGRTVARPLVPAGPPEGRHRTVDAGGGRALGAEAAPTIARLPPARGSRTWVRRSEVCYRWRSASR